jgi:hypothetical protein
MCSELLFQARGSARVDRFVRSLAMTMLVMLSMAHPCKRDSNVCAANALVDRPARAALDD